MITNKRIVEIGQKSILRRLADKIEPTDQQLKAADKLPKHSRVMRLIKPARVIKELADVLRIGQPGPPKPTGAAFKSIDNKPMAFYTDGSIRHAGGRLKGKAIRKAFKRQMQRSKHGAKLRVDRVRSGEPQPNR